ARARRGQEIGSRRIPESNAHRIATARARANKGCYARMSDAFGRLLRAIGAPRKHSRMPVARLRDAAVGVGKFAEAFFERQVELALVIGLGRSRKNGIFGSLDRIRRSKHDTYPTITSTPHASCGRR